MFIPNPIGAPPPATPISDALKLHPSPSSAPLDFTSPKSNREEDEDADQNAALAANAAAAARLALDKAIFGSNGGGAGGGGLPEWLLQAKENSLKENGSTPPPPPTTMFPTLSDLNGNSPGDAFEPSRLLAMQRNLTGSDLLRQFQARAGGGNPLAGLNPVMSGQTEADEKEEDEEEGVSPPTSPKHREQTG